MHLIHIFFYKIHFPKSGCQSILRCSDSQYSRHWGEGFTKNGIKIQSLTARQDFLERGSFFKIFLKKSLKLEIFCDIIEIVCAFFSWIFNERNHGFFGIFLKIFDFLFGFIRKNKDISRDAGNRRANISILFCFYKYRNNRKNQKIEPVNFCKKESKNT